MYIRIFFKRFLGSNPDTGSAVTPDWLALYFASQSCYGGQVFEIFWKDEDARNFGFHPKVPLLEEFLHHLGCIPNPVNNEINYQPQLVSKNRISETSTVQSKKGIREHQMRPSLKLT